MQFNWGFDQGLSYNLTGHFSKLWIEENMFNLIKYFADCEGVGKKIKGEVFKIDQEMLEHLGEFDILSSQDY